MPSYAKSTIVTVRRNHVNSVRLFGSVQVKSVSHAVAVHCETFRNSVGAVNPQRRNCQPLTLRISRIGQPASPMALLLGPRELKRCGSVLSPLPRVNDLGFRRHWFTEIAFDLSSGVHITNPGGIPYWNVGSVSALRRGGRGGAELVCVGERGSYSKRRESRSCGNS